MVRQTDYQTSELVPCWWYSISFWQNAPVKFYAKREWKIHRAKHSQKAQLHVDI